MSTGGSNRLLPTYSGECTRNGQRGRRKVRGHNSGGQIGGSGDRITMKSALVCGAGGFIGTHLVRRLKSEGYWVAGADLKRPEFSATAADEFVVGDLRDP